MATAARYHIRHTSQDITSLHVDSLIIEACLLTPNTMFLRLFDQFPVTYTHFPQARFNPRFKLNWIFTIESESAAAFAASSSNSLLISVKSERYVSNSVPSSMRILTPAESVSEILLSSSCTSSSPVFSWDSFALALSYHQMHFDVSMPIMM